jgi:plastocyanin
MSNQRIFKIATPLVTGILLAFVITMGCSSNKSTNPNGPSGTPPPQHSSHYHAVSIAGMAFSPAALSVAVGDTVIWTNSDNAPHTVTSDTGNELNSPTIGQGQTYTHIFAIRGSFPYHCSVHPSMHGGVTVQ